MPKFDIETIKQAAAGRWPEIFSSLASVSIDVFDGHHHPCPKCGGTDRFRLIDSQAGACLCNQCLTSKNGDGLAVVQWLLDCDFKEVLTATANYLGIKPKAEKQKIDPTEHLEFLPWNSVLVSIWCAKKKPIKPDAIKAIGGRLAKYRNQYTVIAIPVWGPSLDEMPAVGWVLYRADGKDLPKWKKGFKTPEWRKVKLTHGSVAGIIAAGNPFKESSDAIWKTEGPTDLLSLLSVEPERPAFTTANGAKETPQDWIVRECKDRDVVVVHDADKPGQEGATWLTNEQGQKSRAGWCPALATEAADVRNLTLPFPVEPTNGPDLRDFFAGGGSIETLAERLENAERFEPPTAEQLEASLYSFLNPDGAGLTDLANAKRFVDRFADEVLFVPEWRKWLAWDGTRWADDSGVGVRQRAHRYAESLWNELAAIGRHVDASTVSQICRFIKASSQAAKIDAFLKLAQVDDRIVCPVAKLNSNFHVLNVKNGTIDLRSGELKDHDPCDRITQLAGSSYDPDADCPEWLKTLEIVFAGDAQLIRLVQQILGYAISGDTGEHLLPIGWGDGNNGKSTIWSVVVELLAEYAGLANESLLMGDSKNHPTEIAQLYRKRFVAISEPEMNAKLREARVKELTGDRQITARRMKEDFWTFERTHTFWLSTNHKPRISGTDQGIWRRIKLIPFTVDIKTKVEKAIPDFDRWLVGHEGPGILAWLVRGYRDYLANGGFIHCDAVDAITQDFKKESDVIGSFLAEYCEEKTTGEVGATVLFEKFRDDFGGRWSQTAFGKSMASRGFEKKRIGKNKLQTYLGLELADCVEDSKSASTMSTDAIGDEPKEPGKQDSKAQDTVGHTDFVKPHTRIGNLGVTESVCQTVSTPEKCGWCGKKMIAKEKTHDGFQNFDCSNPDCENVLPLKLEATIT